MSLTAEEQINEIWKLFKDTDRRMKETSLQMKETDTKIKKLTDLFTGQWGKLIEALVEPGALQLFKDRGIQVHQLYRRVESQLDSRQMEIDLLLANETELVVIEVKTTLKVDDVRHFLEDLNSFTNFFHQYKDYRIYGAVAALNIEEEADKFAYRKGLFVLKGGKEGLISILNDDNFKPKDFSKNSA